MQTRAPAADSAQMNGPTDLGSRDARSVLEGVDARNVIAAELAHGNTDLIRALNLGRLAGPFGVVNPWELEDEHGVRRINAGGYAASPFGDRYPPLIDFVISYLQEGRSMGLPQQAASEWRAALECRLVELLASFAPSHHDSQVFFSNSGAEAIEGAIKFVKASRPESPYFVNFTHAYHGKTLGALSLTPNPEYQDLFRPLALDVVTLPFGDLDAFEITVKRLGADRIAGVVLEPIQGEAGVIVPPASFLKQVDALCKHHGILVVVDEIQTGLGRCGHWFASVEWGGMDPDIVTLAKALGGGLMAVGATIVRRPIFMRMLGGLASKRHSNTFGGNSLAMAVGLKSLEIIREEGLVERARTLGEHARVRLERIALACPKMFAEVRTFGLLIAVEFHPVAPARMSLGQQQLVGELTGLLGLLTWHRAGVQANLSLNSRRTVRLTPALTMPDALFDVMIDRIEAISHELHDSWHMLTHTSPKTLYQLSRFALFE